MLASRSQTVSYLCAEARERSGRISTLRMNHHAARGISTTRGSDRNWRR